MRVLSFNLDAQGPQNRRFSLENVNRSISVVRDEEMNIPACPTSSYDVFSIIVIVTT